MIFAPTNIHGIDYQIYLIQYYLESKMPNVWACNKAVYGRCHETERSGTKRLEVNVNGKEYSEPFVNDKHSVVVGFRVLSRSVTNYKLTATIDAIFTVNVFDALGTTDYNDEKVLMQAYDLVNNCGLVRNITDIKTGVDSVFSGLNVENIKHRDMAPMMVFAFTCEIDYTQELC
jgi:hypothetical protein